MQPAIVESNKIGIMTVLQQVKNTNWGGDAGFSKIEWNIYCFTSIPFIVIKFSIWFVFFFIFLILLH